MVKPFLLMLRAQSVSGGEDVQNLFAQSVRLSNFSPICEAVQFLFGESVSLSNFVLPFVRLSNFSLVKCFTLQLTLRDQSTNVSDNVLSLNKA